MPEGWKPTTEQVREGYSIDPEDEYRDPINAPANRRANERYFDAWLAAHDREVAAQAWDEGYGDDVDAHTPRTNPYVVPEGEQP